MTRGRCRDGQRAPVPAGQFSRRPWRQAFGVISKPLGAGLRRQYARGFREKVLAGMIEIVRMLVMTEQYRIDRADCVGAQRRAGQLFEFHMRQLIVAGRIEGRIGEQPEPVDLDQRGGAADQGDPKRVHVDLTVCWPDA
jgi:hypothetical protein